MKVVDGSLSADDAKRAARVQELCALGPAGVLQLVEHLTDPSWQVRRRVVAALGSIEGASPQLSELMASHRDDETRNAAVVDALVASVDDVEQLLAPLADAAAGPVLADVAQIMGRRRNARAIPLLIKLTEHADDNVAVAAVEALGRVGGRTCIEALIRCAESGNFFRVFSAIDVLGRSGDPRVISPLSRLLSEPRYALEAARALGRTGDPRAAAPLVAMLTTGNQSSARVAALALQDLAARQKQLYGTSLAVDENLRLAASPASVRKLSGSLNGADATEKIAICVVLGALHDAAAVPVLLPLLDGPTEVARAAAGALAQLGRASSDSLIAAISTGNSVRRKLLLPIVNHASATEAVMTCLSDSDPAVRALACSVLAQLGQKAPVPSLFALLTDPSAQVVHAAVGAIQSLGSEDVLQLATDRTKSPTAAVRRASARIFGYFAHVSTFSVMRELVQDPDAQVRDAAVMGLSLMESDEAESLLSSLAQNPDLRMRATAMRALGQHERDTTGITTLLDGLRDEDAWVRYYAAQALGKLGVESAVLPLVDLLHDAHGQVPVGAIEALSHLKTSTAMQALRQAAASPDPDKQRAALLGLSLSGDSESLDIVLAACAADEPATRLVALSAAAAFSDPRVVPVLRHAAEDSNDAVRTAALGFLTFRPERDATLGLIELLRQNPASDGIINALAQPAAGRVAGILSATEDVDEPLAPVLSSLLVRLNDPEATAALYDLLSSPNVVARCAAAATVSAIGGRAAQNALAHLATHDPDPTVRGLCTLFLTQ